jgi:hypothetical protein
MRHATATILALSCASTLHAQSEDALRQYFEGRTVVVRIDMPASAKGVDIRSGSPQPLDASEQSSRLGYYGVVLRPGDEVQVTKIKVKDDVIEFQLGGGGWGTFGDSAGGTTIPPVTKSNREKDLERQVKSETDRDRKRQLERELDDVRRDREREEARTRVLQDIADKEKQEREHGLAMHKGSRFNLRFEKKVPASALTPEGVMRALGDFVDFPWVESRRPRHDADRRDDRPRTDDDAGSLRKGLSRGEVDKILGKPVSVDEHAEGKLKVATIVYTRGDDRVETVFADGVLVRYTISSK